MKSLLTNEHIISKAKISLCSEVSIIPFIGKPYKIYLEQSKRFIKSFSHENSLEDITIVELLESDPVDSRSYFFNLDDSYLTKGPQFYLYKPIFLYQFPFSSQGQLEIAPGTIIEISQDNFTLKHNASSEHGSSGGIIVFGSEFSAVAIHRGASKTIKEVNYASFLGNIIQKIDSDYENNLTKKRGIKENLNNENNE